MRVGEVGVLSRFALYDDIEAFFDVPLRSFWCAGDPSLTFGDFLGHENLRHSFLLRGPRDEPNPIETLNNRPPACGGVSGDLGSCPAAVEKRSAHLLRLVAAC
jgi:hypothetical protein